MTNDGGMDSTSPGLQLENITAVGKASLEMRPEVVSVEPHFNKLTCVPAQQNNGPTRDLD